MKFEDAVHEFKNSSNLSLRELATMLNVSPSMISAVKKGTRKPSIKLAKKIAALVGTDWKNFYE